MGPDNHKKKPQIQVAEPSLDIGPVEKQDINLEDSSLTEREQSHSVVDFTRSNLQTLWRNVQHSLSPLLDRITLAMGTQPVEAREEINQLFLKCKLIYEESQLSLQAVNRLSVFIPRDALASTEPEAPGRLLTRNYDLDESGTCGLVERTQAKLQEAWESSTYRESSEVTPLFKNTLEQFASLQKALETLKDNKAALSLATSEDANPLLLFEQHSQIENFADPTALLCQQLSLLTESYIGACSQLDGVTVAPYPPERFQKLSQSGAQVTTCRTSDELLQGFCLFFDPAKAITFAPELMDQFSAYEDTAFHQFIITERNVNQAVYRMLFNSMIMQLQFSNAKYVGGFVQEHNRRGFAAHDKLGGYKVIAGVESRLPEFENGRFLGVVTPADARLRIQKTLEGLGFNAGRMASLIANHKLSGLHSQNWQSQAEVWTQNMRQLETIEDRLRANMEKRGSGKLDPTQHVDELRQLTKNTYRLLKVRRGLLHDNRDIETRLKMLHRGREVLHALKRGKPVSNQDWKILDSGQPAQYDTGLKRSQMLRMLQDARDKVVIRITGGCGEMKHRQWEGMLDLFEDSLQGFGGGLLVGGVRMLTAIDEKITNQIRPGITEIPLALRTGCPDMVVGGITLGSERFVAGGRTIVFDEQTWDMGSKQWLQTKNYVTIRNPEVDYCLYVDESQYPDDHRWNAEYEEAFDIVSKLHGGEVDGHNWKQVLLVYNGGKTTEREILKWSNQGWPVVLIDDSERMAEDYCRYLEDSEFAAAHDSLIAVPKNSTSIRAALKELGIITEAAEIQAAEQAFALC